MKIGFVQMEIGFVQTENWNFANMVNWICADLKLDLCRVNTGFVQSENCMCAKSFMDFFIKKCVYVRGPLPVNPEEGSQPVS